MTLPQLARDRAEIAKLHGKAPVILVPTMGGLHDGHLALVKKGRELASEIPDALVCVSIFVNPLQFGPSEDFDIYPRRLEADLESLADLADTCFAPDSKTMYPEQQQIFVTAPGLGDELCGASRPGFFTGVLTVVLKLAELVNPAQMVFGAKDYQQMVLIKRMLTQLNLQVKLVTSPTVREQDGLALSSRNERLSAELRQVAPILHQALSTAAGQIRSGTLAAKACAASRAQLEAYGFEVDYVECRALDLTEAEAANEFIVLGAATLGDVRLIDNVPCQG